MEEIWKDVQDYEGLYQVSNLGRVKSVDRKSNNGHTLKGKILKCLFDKDYYAKVGLCCMGKRRNFFIHRLVAQSFLGNIGNFPIVNHIDEDKTNNLVDNLEWCTIKYNNNYGTRLERATVSNDHKKLASYNNKKIYGKNLKSGETIHFSSIKQASEYLNTTANSIGRVLWGGRKSNHGWVFGYE